MWSPQPRCTGRILDWRCPRTSAPDSFAYWGAVNGCDGTSETAWQQDNSRCERYPGCDDGVEVVLCRIAGGHVLYQNDDGVDIAARAWAYLSAQTLP